MENWGVCMTDSWQRMFLVGAAGVWPQLAYCAWYGLRSLSVRVSPLKLHLVLPERPFFVVMTTTPFAALVPYSVAADGPLTISMSSISSGVRLLRRLIGVDPADAADWLVT